MNPVWVVKAEWNILHTVRRRKANWIRHISRTNCIQRHIVGGKIQGKTESTGRRGRRRKQL